MEKEGDSNWSYGHNSSLKLKTSKLFLSFGCDKENELEISKNSLQSAIRKRPTYIGNEINNVENVEKLTYRKKYGILRHVDQATQTGNNRWICVKQCCLILLGVILIGVIFSGWTFCAYEYDGFNRSHISCRFTKQKNFYNLHGETTSQKYKDLSYKMIANRLLDIYSKYRFNKEISDHVQDILLKFKCNKKMLLKDVKEIQSVSDYFHERLTMKSLEQMLFKCKDQNCIDKIFSELEEKGQSQFIAVKKKLTILRKSCDPFPDEQLHNLGHYLYGPAADYALEMAGGSIIDTPDTVTYEPTAVTVTLFGIPTWKHVVSNPRLIIQGGMMQPGQCWAFHGTEGKVLIKLASPVEVSSVTLEHYPADLLPGYNAIRSAPRHFIVTGFTDCNDCPENGEIAVDLGCFEYNKKGPSRQTFNVHHELLRRINPVKKVLFHFKSNHGNLQYTCIYRVKVHGVLSKEKYAPLSVFKSF